MTTPLSGIIAFALGYTWVTILALIFDCLRQAVRQGQWHLALADSALFVIFFSVPVVLGILYFTNGGAP